MKNLFLLFLLLTIKSQAQEEVRVFLDLQMHPTMHVPYGFFGDGFTYIDPEKPPKEKYKHQFKNVNYADYWENNKGARIIVAGALTKEGIKNPSKARKVIMEQIDYVNQFAVANPKKFVVAKSPQEVRKLLVSSEKTIIIHSIEGAKYLVNSEEDAQFWAAQGVAFITLMHLVDSDLGAAAVRPGLATKLINFKAMFKSKKKRGGLTEKGKKAILWLAEAGIMIDLTHMADQTRIDALQFMEEHNIPPIITHDVFRPIQNNPRGISEEQIFQVYKNNGFVSLPISGQSLKAYKAAPKYQVQLDSMKCHCEGSIDSYKFTYQAVKKVVEDEVSPRLTNQNFESLEEEDKVAFSIGFQSDFNGWLSHSAPRYGKKGCAPILPNIDYEPIEIDGMPHPGYLESQWRLLEKEGVDLSPIKRNAEHFLQLWANFLARKEIKTPK